MTYESWRASTFTKMQSAMNLHDALKNTSLDFFVMTSSVSGTLGSPGQINHAAANSFLDAFAKYRRSQSRRAVSIILPMILGVGVVAENNEIEEALKRKGMYGIDEEHLLEAFEIATEQCPPWPPLARLMIFGSRIFDSTTYLPQ